MFPDSYVYEHLWTFFRIRMNMSISRVRILVVYFWTWICYTKKCVLSTWLDNERNWGMSHCNTMTPNKCLHCHGSQHTLLALRYRTTQWYHLGSIGSMCVAQSLKFKSVSFVTSHREKVTNKQKTIYWFVWYEVYLRLLLIRSRRKERNRLWKMSQLL